MRKAKRSILCVFTSAALLACGADDDPGTRDDPPDMARADSGSGVPDLGSETDGEVREIDGGRRGCETGAGSFAVSAVSGPIADGAEVTICGDRFGDLGPTILLFDDMEGGRAGDPIAADGPAVGTWTHPSGRYVDDGSRSGTKAMLLADSEVTEGGGVSATVGLADEAGRFGLRHFDEMFIHLSIRDLGDFPGNDSSPTQFSSVSSAKDVWLMFGDRGDNYEYSCRTECNGHDLVIATHTSSGSFKTDGNSTRSSWWLPGFCQFQAWNTMSTYLRIDLEEPYAASTGVFEHVSGEGGYVRSDYEGQILQELDGLPPEWDRFKLGAWYRRAGDVRRILDDLYIAIGPGAAARIEIANAEAIEDATRLAVSTVSDWSATEIAATLRLGDLEPAAEPLYLFVVTATGERSPGYRLTP